MASSKPGRLSERLKCRYLPSCPFSARADLIGATLKGYRNRAARVIADRQLEKRNLHCMQMSRPFPCTLVPPSGRRISHTYAVPRCRFRPTLPVAGLFSASAPAGGAIDGFVTTWYGISRSWSDVEPAGGSTSSKCRCGSRSLGNEALALFSAWRDEE